MRIPSTGTPPFPCGRDFMADNAQPGGAKVALNAVFRYGCPFACISTDECTALRALRLKALVSAASGVLMRRPSARVDLVAVGHGTAAKALADGPSIILPRGLPDGVPVISERSLQRLLGLLPAQGQENRTFTAEGLAGTCRVPGACARSGRLRRARA